jgi:hypothetical protein
LGEIAGKLAIAGQAQQEIEKVTLPSPDEKIERLNVAVENLLH